MTTQQYEKALTKLINKLDEAQTKTTIHNIRMGKFIKKPELIKSVKFLIENHTVIYDGKQSLFFKKTGLMIWEKEH